MCKRRDIYTSAVCIIATHSQTALKQSTVDDEASCCHTNARCYRDELYNHCSQSKTEPSQKSTLLSPAQIVFRRPARNLFARNIDSDRTDYVALGVRASCNKASLCIYISWSGNALQMLAATLHNVLTWLYTCSSEAPGSRSTPVPLRCKFSPHTAVFPSVLALCMLMSDMQFLWYRWAQDLAVLYLLS
jgi:hypothetical protein